MSFSAEKMALECKLGPCSERLSFGLRGGKPEVSNG